MMLWHREYPTEGTIMTFPKKITPGDTIELHGDVTIAKSIIIPAGKPVTVCGDARIHFNGKGAKTGNASMFVFNVGARATLNVKPGLYFDLNPFQGVVKLAYDPRHDKIATAGSAYLDHVHQTNGCLVWCEGMKEVRAANCITDGFSDKYYAITATNPNGKLVLDFRGVKDKPIRGGEHEGVIRTMQLDRFELYGATVREQTKQGVQVRSGNTALIQDCDLLMLAVGWMEDKSLKNPDPLNRVDINNTKLKGIDWGNGQSGQVFRDGKRIR